ncbi:DegT/DnrJ/EryC1/StrS family aminotransferase [Kribbella solani]|uniref:DegT/DnrJ/EryC1/StrS family aminotransferase n=1 Tax=Kribbella solani TaxID=236067 RepID=UPI0029BE5F84|nr:DegT/DnrJ/EryC1/StrS family aminotransferase [Kribbella solani]MDX3005536.1 DegT/DnrJ/EryC1/StrS family aminotransferase [Kribbella solani]
MPESLALQGGIPIRQADFPAWPVGDAAEEAALVEVLRSGRWGSTHGDQVAHFEAEFAAAQQAEYGTCLANGTLALVAAYQAAGVRAGDEVVVPPYTFIATVSAVLFLQAIPVFADVDPETHLLDPAAVEKVITPRTRAVVAVHIGGRPCDLDALTEVCTRNGVALVEDAAQAHGASWRGRRVGAIGDLGTFSFQSSKNLSAGEGGIIVTNRAELNDAVYPLVNVGRTRDGAWYQHDHLGYNLRLTEFQGAILRAQLKRLPEQARRRAENADRLTAGLGEFPDAIALAPEDPAVTEHARHLYLFRLRGVTAAERDWFVSALQAEGVPCSPGYPGLHTNTAVRDRMTELLRAADRPEPAFDCPVTGQLAASTVWLPQNLLLGEESDTADILAAIAKVLHHR